MRASLTDLKIEAIVRARATAIRLTREAYCRQCGRQAKLETRGYGQAGGRPAGPGEAVDEYVATAAWVCCGLSLGEFTENVKA